MQVTVGAARAALVLACCFAAPARAAESFDNCSGFIDSLPATVGTQGVWCLRKDLATAMSSGAAITIAAHNVTIDCNGYRLGGLAAGPATGAVGIRAEHFNNLTVRGCNVRGFATGIDLAGNGVVVEDNRLDANTVTGIYVNGDDTSKVVIVRRNLVRDTGGRPGADLAYGILAHGLPRVIDNVIQGVSATGNASIGGTAYGIMASGGFVLRNHVSGLLPTGDGSAFGAEVFGFWGGAVVADNVFTVVAGTKGRALYGDYLCEGNVFTGFTNAPSDCPIPSNTILPTPP